MRARAIAVGMGIGLVAVAAAGASATAEAALSTPSAPTLHLAVLGLATLMALVAAPIAFAAARQPDAVPRHLFGRSAAVDAGRRSRSGFLPAGLVLLFAGATIGADLVGLWRPRLDPPDQFAAGAEPAPEPQPSTAPPQVAALPEPPATVTPLPPALPTEPPRIEIAAPAPPTVEPPPRTEAPMPATEVPKTAPEGHTRPAVWLSLSPDGKLLMSASTDMTIKLWDAASGRFIRTLGAQKDMARSALFLPGGSEVLSAGDDGEMVLRSLVDGSVLHVFAATEHGGFNKIALSADGTRAVSVHEAGTVIVWDVPQRRVLHVFKAHGWSANGVAITPDGRRAISGAIDGELSLWDLDAGKLVRRWQGHERGTYGALATPDGRYFVTGSGDRTIQAWDAATGMPASRPLTGHSGTIYALALSPDARQMASASLDGTARLWDVSSGRELAMIDAGQGGLYSVVFTAPDVIATGGADNSIRFWHLPDGGRVAMIPGAPERP